MSGNGMVKQGNVGVVAQSTWDTFPTSGYVSSKYNSSTVPAFENAPSLEAREVMGDASVTSAVDRSYFDGLGNLKSMPFETYLNSGSLGMHLNAALQDATISTASGYKPEGSVIDFQANEGTVYSIHKKWSSGQRFSIYNAVLDSLNFSLDNTATGLAQLMTMGGSWMGSRIQAIFDPSITDATSEYIVADVNAGASLNKWYLTWFDGTTTFTDTCFYSFGLDIANSVEGTCKGEGYFRNFRIKPVLTVNFLVPLGTGNAGTLSNSMVGTEMTFTLRNYSGLGDPVSAGQIKFNADKMICNAAIDADHNGYEALNIQAEILEPTTGWTDVVTYYK